MKKYIVIAAFAVLFFSSCIHTVKGTVLEKDFISFKLLTTDCDTINVATVNAKEGKVDVLNGDVVRVFFKDLKTESGYVRSAFRTKIVKPSIHREITGVWTTNDGTPAVYNFFSDGSMNVENRNDVMFINWEVENAETENPTMKWTYVMVVKDSLASFQDRFSVSVKKSVLSLKDMETGEEKYSLNKQ